MKATSKERALWLALCLCCQLYLVAASSPFKLDLTLPKLELPGHWGKTTHEAGGGPLENEGISDDDLSLAYDDLSSVLDQRTPLPPEMKVLAAGTLPGTSKTSWKVHGMEDRKTGLFQTLYVCHFDGIPMHIMERCVLDEAYQLTYDEFTAQKRVVALRGAGDRSLVAPRPGHCRGSQAMHSGPFGLPGFLAGGNPLDRLLKDNPALLAGGHNPFAAAHAALHAGSPGCMSGGGSGALLGAGRVAKGGSSCSEVVYQESRYPGPVKNRDYVYYRRRHIRPDESVTYVHRDVPPLAAAKYVGPRLGVVRAGNGLYWQRGLIRAEKGTQGSPGSNGTSGGSSGDAGGVHHGGCAVVSRCQDNMEGAMPKWVVAVMAAKGAPAYASTLQRAAVRLMLQDGLVSDSEAKERWHYA